MPINSDELNAILGGIGAGVPPGDAISETFPRRHAISTAFQPATGVLQMFGIYLPGGKVITNINFVSGGTAETGGTHLWFALYDQYLNLLAQSADDTGATTFTANTNLRKALTAAQTTKYAGLYYIGYMQTNGAGAQASLLCMAAPASSVANAIVPIISATSSTGQAATAPNPAAALTVQVNTAYAYVS